MSTDNVTYFKESQTRANEKYMQADGATTAKPVMTLAEKKENIAFVGGAIGGGIGIYLLAKKKWGKAETDRMKWYEWLGIISIGAAIMGYATESVQKFINKK